MKRHMPRLGFSLLEIMVVAGLLAILAALVVPKYLGAQADAEDSAVAKQLQVVRNQIELYRADQKKAPQLLVSQWNDLVSGGYLKMAPENPLNESTLIAAAPGAGVGWVWRDKGNGKLWIYATDETGLAEYP